MRLPNVFTALADVMMGFLFVNQWFEPVGAVVLLVLSSGLLYTAGMILNDLWDYHEDLVERPQRPLPSGQISLGAAQIAGFGMLGCGVACAWLAGLAFGDGAAVPWRSGTIGTALAAAVIAYDAWLKRTPIGPVGMGLCRFLNVLLGMSLAGWVVPGWPLGYGPVNLLPAAGIGIYVAGVTLFSRSEAATSKVLPLAAAMGVMTLGIVVAGCTALQLTTMRISHNVFWLVLGLLLATVLRRCFMALISPTPQHVQIAVKHSILSLIWFDAAICAAVARPEYALAIAALLIPALILGHWVYST